MEFDPKLQENLSIQPVVFPENYFNINKKEELFPYEGSSSTNFFHEMNNLDDRQIIPISNPLYGIQTTCFDTNFVIGSSSNMVDFYECKPFCDSNGGGNNTNNNNFLEKYNNNNNNNNCFRYNQEIIKPMNFIVPDENSSITAESGYYKNKNSRVCQQSTRRPYKRHKKSNVVKGQWTIDEDRLLIQLVEQYGVRKWSNIAQMLPGRIGKQCRERWHNHLRPDIKKETWTEEEDKVLIQAHTEIGNKWAEIAKRLPGRTENSIKNHWNATKRRQYSKRKCRSKYPRGSILQDYIKSLNLDNTQKITIKSSKSSNEELCPNDHIVPNYEFDEVPEFCFAENMFEESCTIDSLLDGEEKFEMEKELEIVDDDEGDGDGKSLALMEFEVKKELDLVEMISEATM